MERKEKVILILVVLLVLSLGYIGMLKYKDREMRIYQEGVNLGYQGAIVDIINKAVTCQQVPLYAEGGNISVNLVAVECLQNFGVSSGE